LDLGALAGLLESCDVMLGNDSGPRHLAQAVGTPTAGIYWVGNAIMAAPLGRATHRVQMGWTTHCPVCGTDLTQVGWTARRCEHDDFSLTEAVEPAEVFRDVVDLTATSPRLRGR
jgi:ADP-heptose:LPS heptosyltransferase